MPEALSKNPDGEQQPLFHIHPGTYGGDVIEPVLSTQQAESPEGVPLPAEAKPRSLYDLSVHEMVQIALYDRLPAHMPGVDDKRRDAFIEKYHWIPFDEMEMTAAIGENRWGVPSLVRYITGARQKNGISAAQRVVHKIEGVRARATNTAAELQLAFEPEAGEFLPGVMKDDEEIRTIIAKEIFALNCLNMAEWKNEFRQKAKTTVRNPDYDNRIIGIKDHLRYLTAEQAEVLCRRTLAHQQARAKFWAEQIKLAEQHTETAELIAAIRKPNA
jgi:hypothetical protein